MLTPNTSNYSIQKRRVDNHGDGRVLFLLRCKTITDFVITNGTRLLRFSLCLLASAVMSASVLADELIIDDRTNHDLTSNLTTRWRLITDTVMGGVSSGTLKPDTHNDKSCLRMTGDVSTDNNGGFVQMSLSLAHDETFDASAYDGVELEVAGNNERYNIHFRTDGLWFPWQSYRASFNADTNWQKIRIPFSELEAYRTFHAFRPDKLERLGLLAIGREFQADLCLASIRFYSNVAVTPDSATER